MDFSKPYNRTEFVNFLRRDFLPDDFEQTAKNVTFGVQMNFASSAVKLGACKSLDLVVYEIKHTSHNDARVGLSKDAFRMLAGERQSRALVIFVPEDRNANYRFSLIEISLTIGENETKVTRTYSNPRRYSYYLGKDIACYTPNKYLNDLGKVTDVKDLFERFSVEVLTKAFYNELSDWYAWAIKEISFPNDITTTKDDTEYNHIAAIRLITRLIFVWFIKQRGLVPWQFFDEDYIRENLLENFNPNVKVDLFYKATDSKYYRAILQNLFFAMLNAPLCKEGSKEITERKFKDNRGQFDDNKLMRYRNLFKNPELFLQLANSTVPFLNGGLFDCLDDKKSGMYYDGFSERKESIEQLRVPDYLFFGEEVGRGIDLSDYYGDKTKKKVSARGIIDILKRYNFTVEENMPFDKDISLDPELLGKVFENLLAAYNPETKQTARKQTGSFYTPREIVQYMVDESLVAHLKRTVSEDLESEYRKLLSYSDDIISLDESQKQKIMQSLYNCKILDPACGSGAFPVGILQQMVHILTQIDPDNSRWRKMLFDLAQDESSEVFKNSTDEERKEQLDDLYHSFNANFNRPDYSRKLYIIENCIYGVDIQPIAIQISKLRLFISLIIDQKPNNDPTDNFGIRPLPNLEAKFVAANSLIGLKREDGNLFNTKEINEKENQLKIAKHKIFSAKTARTKRKYEEQVDQLCEDIANMLVEQRLVGNDQAQQLTRWKMSDQNASSPFLDSEWMFGVKDGFDIVIANPPYVFTRDVSFSKEFKNYVEKEYFSKVYNNDIPRSKSKQSGKINLFAIFIMRGVMLNSIKGILTYIVPNNLLRTTIYDNVRKFILTKSSINQIIDLGSGVFDNVTASTIIMQLSKQYNIDNQLKVISNISDLSQNDYDVRNIEQAQFLKNTSYTFNIYSDEIINNISQKICQNTLLGSYCKDIIEGIVAHKHLIKEIYSEGYVPLLEGKCVRRYYNKSENKYLKWDKQLIHRPRPDYLWDLDKKILIQRISGGEKPIIAAIDTKKYKTFASINNLVLKNEYGDYYEFFVALLNSTVENWFYANNFSNKSKLTVNVSKTYLQMLPVPPVSDKIKSEINSLVKRIMEDKENGNDTTFLEKMIDKLFYKLYDLTYDEVLIIDPQTPISREEYGSFNLDAYGQS